VLYKCFIIIISNSSFIHSFIKLKYNNTQAAVIFLYVTNVVNSDVNKAVQSRVKYPRHSLGGSARIDQTINQLGFSENHLVIIDQSDACLHFAELPLG